MMNTAILPGPIVIEHRVLASSNNIWLALTGHELMKLWYFDIAEFRPEIGFKFQFRAGDDKQQFYHYCQVTEVVPGQKLAYTWRYDETPDSLVRFELISEGNSQTLVRLTHEGLDHFPKDKPAFAKINFAEGWKHIIGKSLKEFVEKKQIENNNL